MFTAIPIAFPRGSAQQRRLWLNRLVLRSALHGLGRPVYRLPARLGCSPDIFLHFSWSMVIWLWRWKRRDQPDRETDGYKQDDDHEKSQYELKTCFASFCGCHASHVFFLSLVERFAPPLSTRYRVPGKNARHAAAPVPPHLLPFCRLCGREDVKKSRKCRNAARDLGRVRGWRGDSHTVPLGERNLPWEVGSGMECAPPSSC